MLRDIAAEDARLLADGKPLPIGLGEHTSEGVSPLPVIA